MSGTYSELSKCEWIKDAKALSTEQVEEQLEEESVEAAARANGSVPEGEDLRRSKNK